MKKTVLNLCIAIGLAVALSNCTSMSTLQTARTTEQGEFGYSASGGYVTTKMDMIDTTIQIKAPILDGTLRYGITDKLDVGAKLTIIGTSGIDAKYQFLGDKESLLAGASGFGYGRLTITSGDYKTAMNDIMFPLYFSVHPTDWFSAYASPKYILRILSSTDASTGSTSSGVAHWYGSTLGVRIGNEAALLVEYSIFGNSNMSSPLGQFNIGVCKNF